MHNSKYDFQADELIQKCKECIDSGKLNELWSSILTDELCEDPPSLLLTWIFESENKESVRGKYYHYTDVALRLVTKVPIDVLRGYIGQMHFVSVLSKPIGHSILERIAPCDARCKFLLAIHCVSFCDSWDMYNGKSHIDSLLELHGVSWEYILTFCADANIKIASMYALTNMLPYVGAKEALWILASNSDLTEPTSDCMRRNTTPIVSRLLDTIITASEVDALFEMIAYKGRHRDGGGVIGALLVRYHSDAIACQILGAMNHRHWLGVVANSGVYSIGFLSGFLSGIGPASTGDYDRALLILSSIPAAVKRHHVKGLAGGRYTVSTLLERDLTFFYQDKRNSPPPEELLCALRVPTTAKSASQ